MHITGGDGTIAQLVRDGQPLEPELHIVGNDFSGVFEDEPGPGEFRYRVQILSAGGQPIVITSHFYVQALDRAAEGCGCDAGGGIAGGIVPLLVMLAPCVRRRRVAA